MIEWSMRLKMVRSLSNRKTALISTINAMAAIFSIYGIRYWRGVRMALIRRMVRTRSTST